MRICVGAHGFFQRLEEGVGRVSGVHHTNDTSVMEGRRSAEQDQASFQSLQANPFGAQYRSRLESAQREIFTCRHLARKHIQQSTSRAVDFSALLRRWHRSCWVSPLKRSPLKEHHERAMHRMEKSPSSRGPHVESVLRSPNAWRETVTPSRSTMSATKSGRTPCFATLKARVRERSRTKRMSATRAQSQECSKP
jgi:hypothetical protein